MHRSCHLTYVRQLCKPYQLPENWQSIQADRFAFIGPSRTDGVLGALLVSHSAEELVRTRMAVLSGDGTLALNPLLAVPDVLTLVMVDREIDAIYTLVT